MKYKPYILMISCFVLCIGILCVLKSNENVELVKANADSLSNTKVCWGIKRAQNHEQPDLGTKNKQLIDQLDGIAMGNKEKPYVYLTFDEGYEAGYTSQILDTLKENNVTATFFITAHYFNTQEELVKRMIEEGHTVGNHIPNSLMSGNYKTIKC